MREKVGKSRNTVFFQWFVAQEGRKVGSLKRRVRSHLARWEMKKCTPLWREAHFQVKMYKTPQRRSAFGSCDVEKVHAVVARSTFRSQNVQNTPFSDHFWKLRCRKSARRCGAKHISKSKCTKHLSVGRLLEVAIVEKVHAVVARSTFRSQNVQSTTCKDHFWSSDDEKVHAVVAWAHFQVKMYKAHHVQTIFGGSDVEKVHAVVARSTFPSQNVKNTRGSDRFWSSDVASLRFTTLHYMTLHTLHYTTLHYTPLHYITQHYNCNNTTTLHYNTLHYTTLNYTTLHYTTLHSTTLPCTTLHYITLHYTPLQI